MRNSTARKSILSALLMTGVLLVSGLLVNRTVLAQGQGGGGGQGRGGPRTMTGVVSDAMCGAKHMGADAAKCTVSCAKSGKYALVVGDRVITLDEAPAADMEKLANQKATVTGTMTGRDSMKVTSVAAAKEQS